MIAFSPKLVTVAPLTESIRRSLWLIRSVGSLVIISFLGALLAPTAVAAQNWREPRAIETPAGKPDELSSTLQEAETLLQGLLEPGSVGMARSKADKTQLKSRLGELEANLERLDQGVLADFDGVKQWLKDQHLPATMVSRHEQTVATYRQEMKALRKNLGAVRAAKKDNAMVQAAGTALNQLKQHRNKRSHQPLDPQNLPFSVADGKTRKPHTTPEALNDLLFPPVKAAKNAKTAKTALKQGRAAPTADDLAQTIEVQFTQPIQDLATQLERNPVKIYNWVHNNIEFIPTYGSIQGADMTLQTQRGNAFDTASLLIALLRASGIHARYAYGTVEIPIEKVMNWVGGTTSPEAGLQMLGQGGIPNVGLTQGGKFIAAQLEHIWVEAWVDFAPSRGAKHKTGDSWVPMDASFKQYEFTAGMNLEQTVPFDAQAFADTLTQTAQINEAEGWVQGIDQNYIQTSLQSYQTQLQSYIQQTKADATVGDVLGRQRIIQRDAPILATGLPYSKVITAATPSVLPPSMRLGFQFDLNIGSAEGSSLLAFNRSLPELAGKRLTLSFEPATEADRQVIESYLPEVPASGEIDPSTLPTSLPAYLINLTAELKLDGEIVASAGPITMGDELASTTRISRLSGGWHQAVNYPIAGEFYAFGIDGQGISAPQLQAVKTRLEGVKTQLETKNLNGLTKDGLIGDLLYAAVTSYFAAHDANLSLMNRTGQALAYRQPSFGVFSTSLDPVYRFGIAYQVKMGGLDGDMDAVAQSVWAKNHDAKISKASVQQLGMLMSTLEYRIPELFFTNEQNPGEAVSAVKALALASAQGQKIYQINSANVGVLNGLAIGTEVKSDIAAAVELGREVTVSEGTITVAGWTGVGYIITDPATGSGAYKISGGGNGVKLILELLKIIAMVFATLIVIGGVPIFIAAVTAETLSITIAAISMGLAWISIKENISSDSPWRGFLVDIAGGVGIGLFLAAFYGITVSAVYATIVASILYAIFDVFVYAMLHRSPYYDYARYSLYNIFYTTYTSRIYDTKGFWNHAYARL